MIHPRLQAGVELQLDKEAVSVFDEYGEFARFDPLFYDDDFDDTDPAALAEVIRHFRDVSKANSYKSKIFVTTDEDQRGYGKEVDPAEAEKELRRMAAAGEKLDYDSPGFPDYYSVQYPRGLRKRIAAVIKKDPPEDSDEWDFGLSAIDQALDAYRAGKEKKAAENTPADDPSDDMDATIEKIEEDFHAGLIDQAEAMKRFNMAMWGDEGKWTDENIAANSAEKKASWTDIGITGYLQGYLPKTAAKKTTENIARALVLRYDEDVQDALNVLEGSALDVAAIEEEYDSGKISLEEIEELGDIVDEFRRDPDYFMPDGEARAEAYGSKDGVPISDEERLREHKDYYKKKPQMRRFVKQEGVGLPDLYGWATAKTAAEEIPAEVAHARRNAEAFMQDKTRRKYTFFGPKVTKKAWGVDMLGQRMDPDYFMPDYEQKGIMVRTEGPDPLNRYHPSVHDAPIGTVYY